MRPLSAPELLSLLPDRVSRRHPLARILQIHPTDCPHGLRFAPKNRRIKKHKRTNAQVVRTKTHLCTLGPRSYYLYKPPHRHRYAPDVHYVHSLSARWGRLAVATAPPNIPPLPPTWYITAGGPPHVAITIAIAIIMTITITMLPAVSAHQHRL